MDLDAAQENGFSFEQELFAPRANRAKSEGLFDGGGTMAESHLVEFRLFRTAGHCVFQSPGTLSAGYVLKPYST